ncbi:MAG: hypothetical protein Gaeavirus7_8 [Gaeavirus sp.]|uniref:Uncharacterized protein n=1 Tax=Gaeavirus sp. TaxID=2487767 RepID=A0A3G5A1I5_9VIRU|nr:MAG: hypothetical protein Gaeavirus7_8 [Gaeavirus sp.]
MNNLSPLITQIKIIEHIQESVTRIPFGCKILDRNDNIIKI